MAKTSSSPPRNIDGIVRQPQAKAAKPRRTKWRAVLATVTIVLAILLVLSGWLLISHHHPKANDVERIKTKIGRLYLLPTDEQPALATITDSSKLSGSFSAQVQNGDKVLIYQTNKKAIVYRPSIDRIVDVEPVVLNNATTNQSSAIPNINPFGN